MKLLQSNLPTAIAFATYAHEGQLDRAGQPFIGHPLRVMAYAAQQFELDEQALIAAVLHDVVEDTSVELVDIRRQFGDYVYFLVDLLTRRDDQTYKEYIQRIADAAFLDVRDAIFVKLADIKDNTDERRITHEEDTGWHRGLVKDRYEPARAKLFAALGLW